MTSVSATFLLEQTSSLGPAICFSVTETAAIELLLEEVPLDTEISKTALSH